MSLDSIISDNLDFLCSIEENNKYKVIDNKIVEDNDNFHDVNSTNIEFTIINTLLFALHTNCQTLSQKRIILEKINISLTNIYENEHLNLIIQKSKYFSDSLNKIDEIYDYNIEKFRNNKCNLFWINFNINFNRFLNHTISVCKTMHYTTMKINGMITSDDEIDILEEDSDESYEELNAESSDDNDNNEKKIN